MPRKPKLTLVATAEAAELAAIKGIRQTPTGRWEMSLHHPLIGGRITKNFASRDEAARYKRDRMAELARGIVLPELLGPATGTTRPGADTLLIDMLRDYIKNRDHPVAASDIPTIEAFMDLWPQMTVASCTTAWAKDWVRSLKAARLKPATIIKRVQSLRRAFRWYAIEEASKRMDAGERDVRQLANPLEGIRVQYGPADLKPGEAAPMDETRDRTLGEGEEDAILAAIAGEVAPGKKRPFPLDDREAMRMLYQFLVNTGCRLREAVWQRAGAVSFKATKELPPHVMLLGSKRKPHQPEKRRPVPFYTKAFYEDLKAYMDKRGLKGDALLFPFWDGLTPRSLAKACESVARTLKNVFQYAGCEDLLAHDLRHEGITRMILLKHPDTGHFMWQDYEVMIYSGHTSHKVFSRYTNLRQHDKARKFVLV